MTTDLDTRLQSMAGALRHAVPEAPPPRRPPGPGRVVVGTALVLVAAFGAFTAVRSEDSRDVDATQVANLRGLVADELPDGLALSWAGQQSGQITAEEGAVAGAGESVTDLQSGPVELYTYLYGGGTATGPFGAEDLVINVWQRAEGLAPFDAGQAAGALTGAVTSTVQGQAALVCDVASCSGTGTGEAISSVHWVTAQGQEIVAASRSLDAAQLQAIAENLKVEGTNVALGALPPELAGKLAEVGSLAETFLAGARQVDAYWVGYSDGGVRAVDVTTSAGDVDDLMAKVWALGASAEQIEVRGHEAFVASTGGAEGALELVWQESAQVVARVSAVGLSQEQLIGFVEQLRWVAEGEWTEVEELAAAAQAALPATTLPSLPGEVEGDVSVDAGDTSVEADVEVSPDGVDVGVQVDSPLGQLEANLHTGVGAEAVIGPLNALGQAGQDAAEQAQEHMTNPSPPLP